MRESAAAMSAPPKEIAERLDAVLAPWNRSDAPGVAAAVRARDGWGWRAAAGLACLAQGNRLTPATRMRIASITKQFLCVLTFGLAREGKLKLEDSARRYLPELSEAFEPVSVRQLMDHTSGIWSHEAVQIIMNGSGAIPNAEQIFAAIARQDRLSYPPGTKHSYTNAPFVLLGHIAERIEGARLEEILARRFFQPIGMTETLLLRRDITITPRLATLHIAAKDGRFDRGIFPTWLSGEGGIVSTVDDLLRWQAHLDAPHAFPAEDWQSVTQQVKLLNGATIPYCHGVAHTQWRGQTWVLHDGGVPGATGRLARLVEPGIDIAVLTNRSDARANEIACALADAIFGREPLPAPAPSAAAFSGVYLGESRIYPFTAPEGVLNLGMDADIWKLAESGDGFVRPELDQIGFRVLPGKASGPEPAEIIVEISGVQEICPRLPPIENDMAEFARFAGAYRCAGMAGRCEIFAGPEPKIKMTGDYGNFQAEIRQLAPNIWIAHTALAPHSGALLRLEPSDGDVRAFQLDVPRMRARFERIDHGE